MSNNVIRSSSFFAEKGTDLQWVPSKELEALYIGWAAVINEFSNAAIIEFKVLNIIVGFDCFSQKS